MEVNINCSDERIYFTARASRGVATAWAFDMYDEDGRGPARTTTVDLDVGKFLVKPDPICKYDTCKMYEMGVSASLRNWTVVNETAAFTIDTSFHRKSDAFKIGCRLVNSTVVIYSTALRYDVQLDCRKQKYYAPRVPDSRVYYLYNGTGNDNNTT